MKSTENTIKSREEMTEIISSLEQQIRQRDNLISVLETKVQLANQRQFARKSEKNPPDENQLKLGLFDEATLVEGSKEIEEADETITISTHTRKKSGRKPLPKNLPRVKKIHDISEDEKNCSCGCTLTLIGQDVTEQLDIIPAKIQVIEHVKLKYACKGCEQIVKTAAPKQPIPKSIASAGLLATVITNKYCDHLPLYRQERIFQRMGIDIPRNTLSNWMIKSSNLLLPLYKLLIDNIETYDMAYADETRAQVLKEVDRRAEQKGYMWCFIGGPINKRSIVYHYDPGRSHTIIEELFPDFTGYLHCDGFSGYDAYSKDRDVSQVGCWAHARRKFVEVTKLSSAQGLAHKIVKLIAKLYAVEKSCKQNKMNANQILHSRKRKSLPVLNTIRKELEKNQAEVLPKSPLGQAIRYSLNQWPKLMRYIDDGRCEIDNNRAERAIKPFVIGRKNWLFSASIAGARAGEIIFSLIETAKAHNIKPYAYFRYILKKLPYATTEEELSSLLPFNFEK